MDELHIRVGKIGDALCEPYAEGAGEAKRQVDIIAMVIVALECAADAGIVPWDRDTLYELGVWATDRMVGERIREREHDPNHRMLHNVLAYIDDDVAHAPFVVQGFDGEELNAKPRGLIGLRQGDSLYTCEGWVKKTRLHVESGVSARAWLKWCMDEGIITHHSQQRICGYRQRFWVLDLIEASERLNPNPCPTSPSHFSEAGES